MKDAIGQSALQAYATNSSKVKFKNPVPRLDIAAQRRSSAKVGELNSFKTPLKSDRSGKKRESFAVFGNKSGLMRINSQKQFQTGPFSKASREKSKDDLLKASNQKRKSNIGIQRAGFHSGSDMKVKR